MSKFRTKTSRGLTPDTSDIRSKSIALALLHAAPSVKRAAAAFAMGKDSVESLCEAPFMGEELCARIHAVDRSYFDTDQGFQYITICCPEYPAQLRTIPDPPLGIFIRGVIPDEWPQMVAVVGSRNCDREGVSYARDFSKAAALHLPVVSGLALGIDGAAHLGSLLTKSALPTVAVIANGIDSFYPMSHRQLGHEILEAGGIVISEYPPGTPSFPNQFLERNRIIAGLCSSLLVVQAAKRSGALVTARLALEYGRDLYTIPWSLDNKRGEGCNKLIQDGAQVMLSPEEFVENLGFKNEVVLTPTIKLSKEEREVVEILKRDGTIHIDELRRQLGDAIDLTLLNLELSQMIERIPGNFLTLGSG